jgi:hypothetical protein
MDEATTTDLETVLHDRIAMPMAGVIRLDRIATICTRLFLHVTAKEYRDQPGHAENFAEFLLQEAIPREPGSNRAEAYIKLVEDYVAEGGHKPLSFVTLTSHGQTAHSRATRYGAPHVSFLQEANKALRAIASAARRGEAEALGGADAEAPAAAPALARELREQARLLQAPVDQSRISKCLNGTTSTIPLMEAISIVIGVPAPVFVAADANEARELAGVQAGARRRAELLARADAMAAKDREGAEDLADRQTRRLESLDGGKVGRVGGGVGRGRGVAGKS